MTPAIQAARKAGITHRVHAYAHVADAASYGEEAADALGIPRERVYKTLLVVLDANTRRLAVGVVPVAGKLRLKAMAAACGARKATMAEPGDAERATGYVVGGISPLGQKRRLPLVLDDSALDFLNIYVSAGRRGLEMELAPQDLLRLTGGMTAAIGA
jgi:Cys-tRNA(Pro)/Cys-tRNA(Cys) deacylase